MLADDSMGCTIHLLARSFANESHPVHITLSLHRREFHERSLRLATAYGVADPEGLVDTLMLLWEGATRDFRSNHESRCIALLFPDLSKQVIPCLNAEPDVAVARPLQTDPGGAAHHGNGAGRRAACPFLDRGAFARNGFRWPRRNG